MINTATNYIIYTAGHRHHHAGTQTQLIPAANGTATAGDSIPVTAFASLPYMGNNLPFAFMSVTGAADGSHLYTTPGTQNIPVGNTNIKILIVYAPAGGIGGNGYGVWVDAFNVDTGNFSDSDFMQVYTNGSLDNAKTATANNDGTVSSDLAEDMRANNVVDGVPFLEWQKINGPTVNAANYNLQMHENGIAFSFYQTPQTRVVPPDLKNREREFGWMYVSPGVMVDGGGIVIGPDGVPHPVDPWGPLMAKLMSTVAILSVSSNMSKEVKVEATKLAVNHLNSLAQSIKLMEIR
ncbi:MAG: hypothetical protein NVSMB63_06760 [Sediminibacterium sp.]